MGLFDFLGDAVDSVRDGVESGTRGFLGGAKEFIERMGNLGSPALGPSLLDKLPLIHDNPLVKLAGSPILGAAQLAIDAMKLTTGHGEPEDGAEFETSAEELSRAGHILVYADPVDDMWDGSASEVYTVRNSQHRHSTFEIRTADHELHRILREEAQQVSHTRATLADYSDFLADFDTATAWLSAVPGGAAVKASIDMTVAASQLGLAQAAIAKLAWDVSDNASKIEGLMFRYQQAADDSLGTLSACKPFGQEKGGDSAGQTFAPPTRTTAETYIPPFVGPPVVYPPATPYGLPPARVAPREFGPAAIPVRPPADGGQSRLTPGAPAHSPGASPAGPQSNPRTPTAAQTARTGAENRPQAPDISTPVSGSPRNTTPSRQ